MKIREKYLRTNIESITKALEKAITKIKHKRNWTQGALARDKWGNKVDTKSPKACRWCAVGAIDASTNNEKVVWDLENLLKNFVQEDSGYMGTDADDADFPSLSSFNYFNDEYATHKDIIGVFHSLLDNLKSKDTK